MRKRRKRKTQAVRLLPVLSLFLAVPLVVWIAWNSAPWLGRAGESAAMLAAAINLPDGSVEVLRERFRAEIYNPEGEHGSQNQEQGQPLPTPAPQTEQGEQEISEGETAPQTTRRIKPVPAEYAAPIIAENFSGKVGGAVLGYNAGLIKNETKYDQEDVEEILEKAMALQFEDTDEPQVLIFHTHATESFEPGDTPTYDIRNTWRSTDNENNMVAVGDALAQVLEDRGIGVLHDDTQHDYPSYNGSYERSAVTIRRYLEEYPSIKVVLDVHRDAMQRDEAIVKPVAVVDGKKAAQIMIISACDDGTMNIPEWRQNLRFAAAFQDRMEEMSPGLTRPIYFCYRKYNMDLTPGSLLLEIGSNGNTLEESIYSATLAGEALADLIQENIENQGPEDTQDE